MLFMGLWKMSYRLFSLPPLPTLSSMPRKSFGFTYRRTFRVAWRTIFPRKEKTELRRQIEAEGLV